MELDDVGALAILVSNSCGSDNLNRTVASTVTTSHVIVCAKGEQHRT